MPYSLIQRQYWLWLKSFLILCIKKKNEVSLIKLNYFPSFHWFSFSVLHLFWIDFLIEMNQPIYEKYRKFWDFCCCCCWIFFLSCLHKHEGLSVYVYTNNTNKISNGKDSRRENFLWAFLVKFNVKPQQAPGSNGAIKRYCHIHAIYTQTHTQKCYW